MTINPPFCYRYQQHHRLIDPPAITDCDAAAMTARYRDTSDILL